MTENYVYKKEVDWSLLHYGITLPLENQIVFIKTVNSFLKRGEPKNIKIYINGKSYKAIIQNVNFDPKFKRKKDTVQLRYSPNSDLSKELRDIFISSYNYIKNIRESRPKNDRSIVKLPDYLKEYLVIYTTDHEDVYVLEPIFADEVRLYRSIVSNQSERIMEDIINYDIVDNTSAILIDERITKIRKLNKKVGDNLKLLYDYRCQICGELIGKDYGTHIIEAHHIDYFTRSLNNNSDNILILCPNHHRIIHDIDPIFDRKKLVYEYPNGYKEGLILNKHLRIG